MYYKVPQKITLEDRVIGPLTFRQFLYLLGGILPSFIIAKILEKFGLNIFLGALFTFPIWLPAVLLAFGKFQEQSLDQVATAFIQFACIPKKLIWHSQSRKSRVKILAKKKKKTEYARPRTLESRLQQIHEQISIYGLGEAQAKSQEEERIVVQPKADLVIKTKIKPLTELPKQEKIQLPETPQPTKPVEQLKQINKPNQAQNIKQAPKS